MRRSVGLGMVLAISVITVSTARAQEPPLEKSPPGELVIVNNNLEEAFGAADVADSSDMRNFVNRLLPRVPYAPDILLLQEVVSISAQNVAAFLSEATGFNYQILVAPGETPHPHPDEDPMEETVRETGIVINADTVEPLGPSGYVQTRYAAEQGLPDQPVRVKEQAYAGIRDLQSGRNIPLMSLHYVANSQAFPEENVAFRYKDQWSNEMVTLMDQTFSEPRWSGPIITGDFNNRRCTDPDETRDCPVLPFWVTMTDKHSFADGIFSAGLEEEIGTRKRIDYMFARLSFLQAASDLEYGDVERSDPSIFYSDHRLMWSLLSVG